MCGRFALNSSPTELAKLFNLPGLPEIKPRFNISPKQRIAAVRVQPDTGNREITELLWWLIPAWSKTSEVKYPTFNAVSETVAEKPAFRSAFKGGRRCLIPLNGFYEWKGEKGAKEPYFFRVHEEETFAIAGIWEKWEGAGEIIESCSILTTEANELVRPIHAKNRMPVILEQANFEDWLNPGTDLNKIQSLCVSYPAAKMYVHPVSRLVNSVRNDSIECIQAV